MLHLQTLRWCIAFMFACMPASHGHDHCHDYCYIACACLVLWLSVCIYASGAALIAQTIAFATSNAAFVNVELLNFDYVCLYVWCAWSWSWPWWWLYGVCVSGCMPVRLCMYTPGAAFLAWRVEFMTSSAVFINVDLWHCVFVGLYVCWPWSWAWPWWWL